MAVAIGSTHHAHSNVVAIAFAIALVYTAPARAAQPTPTATPAIAHTISGRVAEFPQGCQGAQRGVTVVLEPLGRAQQTSLEDGSFRFDLVPPGDYWLRVDYCNPSGCWPEMPVTVSDADAYRLLCPAAGTITPTPGQTPRPTGDLGTKEVSGHVRDELDGTEIPGAAVSYGSGDVVADADGAFAFSLLLHDTDSIRIAAEAPGYVPTELFFSGYELWIAPALEITLLPMRGSIEISPNSGVSLACEGDGEVTITNSEPAGGDDVVIVALSAENSYSQGDYGTGFTSDLSGVELPLTLTPGEHVGFPVHYSAAGQTYPSRLTVQVRSTAGAGFAVPYRGKVAGCDDPTPTATPVRACAGDCDGNGVVTIAELVHGVALALGHDVAPCAGADLDGNGLVVVNELVAAVTAATDGCVR